MTMRGVMEVDRKDLFQIIDKAKDGFVDQQTKLFWKDNDRELNYEEKRIVAILESASKVLKLNLDIKYENKN